MRRRWMILPPMMLLAACAGGPPPAAGPQPGVRAEFPPGGLSGVIRVDALDRLPLRTAELVAPDGSTTPANSIDAEANPSTANGQSSLSDPWRNSELGNPPDSLPGGSGIEPAARSEARLLLTVSTAAITLPDPVAYGRDWQHYRIRLGFAAAGNRLDIREIPAPAPPPG